MLPKRTNTVETQEIAERAKFLGAALPTAIPREHDLEHQLNSHLQAILIGLSSPQREIFSAQLNAAGYSVAVADQLVELATQLADGFSYLVFVPDDFASEAVTAHLRDLRRIAPVVCVFFEVRSDNEIPSSATRALQAIRQGADDHLSLPCGDEQLQACLTHCQTKLTNYWELHETLRTLRQNEEQLKEFTIHLTNQAFWLSDVKNQRCLYISPAYELIFGLSCESLYEDTFSFLPFVHPDDRERLDEYVERRRLGQYAECEYRIQRPDGEERWILSRAFPVRNQKGEIYRLAGISEDITEKKRLEEELLHTQKMQAIGELAGGIAHDFNNLLTPILGYSDLLSRGRLTQDKALKASEMIRKASTRAMELTKQLLGFARKGKYQHVPVDLHKEINELIALVGRTFDKKITLEISLCTAPAIVLGDPNQLHQVLLNLALNARDAMNESVAGTLAFQTSVVDRSDVLANNPAAALKIRPGKYLLLKVRDTGCGIERKNLRRVFEPFFTTKPHGQGSGMGLAMVYGTVRNHGGIISVESEPQVGTEFKICLPLAEEAVVGELVHRHVEPRFKARAGVALLVDDEESVREIGRDMLEYLGYRVLLANDGMEALEVFKQHQNEISLVILDMLMPRLGGHECYKQLRQIKPELPVLLSTGYDLNNSAQKILDDGVRGFIQKPYTLEQFSELTSNLQRETR